MKTILHGFVMTVIVVILLMIIVTIGGRMTRETEARETLESAVDNAVENAIESNTYTIDGRDEFVADVIENLAVQYDSTMDTVDVAINNADETKGSVFLTVTVTFTNPIGTDGTISYSKSCIYSNGTTEAEYQVTYYLDDGTVYKNYSVMEDDTFPLPEADPSVSGKAFLYWIGDDGGTYRVGENFPSTVTESRAFTAVFSGTSVAAKSITLTVPDDVMEVGDTQKLTATVLPTNATNRSLKWSTSDSSILEVDGSGNVTAVAAGTAYITVSLRDNSVASVSAEITVTDITTFKVIADTAYVGTDDGSRYILVKGNSGVYITGECSFVSSDNSVILVNSAGVLTPQGAGTAYITVTHRLSGVEMKLPVIIVEAEGYAGVYDGEAHTISVNCPGADIVYSEDGDFTATSDSAPAYTNAGSYTVYFKASFGGTSVTGSVDVVIEKAERSISTTVSEDTVVYPDVKEYTFETDSNTDMKDVSVYSSDTSVAVVSAEDGRVTVTPGILEGDATITVTAPETDNYLSVHKEILLHVKNATMTVHVTIPQGGCYDGESHCITVTADSPCEDATITYCLDPDNDEYTVSQPDVIDAGTHTIYYRVSKPGYTTVEGSADVTIAKAPGELTFDKQIVTMGTEGLDSLAIATNLSDADVSIVSSGNGLVTVAENNVTIENTITLDGEEITDTISWLAGFTLDSGTTTGYTTLQFKSAESDNYLASTCNVIVYVGEATGLFDSDGNLIAAWDDIVNALGADITKDYTAATALTDSESIYSCLTKLKGGSVALEEGVDYTDMEFASLVVPATQTTIGKYAFAGLDSLGIDTVTLLNGFTEIGSNAFSGITTLELKDMDTLDESNRGAWGAGTVVDTTSADTSASAAGISPLYAVSSNFKASLLSRLNAAVRTFVM